MKAAFSIVSLVIVLGIVAVSMLHQLRANRALAAASSSSSASAAGADVPGGITPAEYRRRLQDAMQQGAALRASEAQAAEDKAARP